MNTGRELARASFQLPGKMLTNRWLFIHIDVGGGVFEYRTETFRGTLVDSKVNPSEPFTSYVQVQVNRLIDQYELVSA